MNRWSKLFFTNDFHFKRTKNTVYCRHYKVIQFGRNICRGILLTWPNKNCNSKNTC